MQVSPGGILVERIVSGGQTGVDQAALQVAIDLGIAHGGWCPRGRRSESGRIPARFLLNESHSSTYGVRTEQNVVGADATLILHRGPLSGGTALTQRLADKHNRPSHCVDLSDQIGVEPTRQWLARRQVKVLNVAGPRQSSSPGIYAESYTFLISVFRPTT